MYLTRKSIVAVILVLTLGYSLPAKQDKQERKEARHEGKGAAAKDVEEYTERAQKAAEVLSSLMHTPDKGIPQELMENAYAVAVIPHVVKAALGVGGRFGKGLVAGRTGSARTWGTPSFVEIGGGSFGFQIGGSATDLVMVFKNEKGFNSLLDSKLKLGADASVAAGPVGRSGEASTDAKLNAEIYSYSRSKGLFAGISLDGAVLTIDDSANRKVYARELTGRDILLKGVVAPNGVTRPFVDALKHWAPKVSQNR